MSEAEHHHDLAWEEESSDELGAAAATTFRYQWLPVGQPTRIVLEGPCPACSEPFTYDWPLVVVRDWVMESAGPRAPEPVTVYCQCRRAHAGRPEGEMGCGRYWELDVPVP